MSKLSMRSLNNPNRTRQCDNLPRGFVLPFLVFLVSASQCMADQEWSATALGGIAKEQHRGRGWEDAALAVGLSAGRTLTPSLAVEAEFTYVPDMFPDAPPIISGKLSVVNVTGTLLYDLTSGNWQPYIAVGAGFGRTRFTQPEFAGRFQNPSHWGPGVNAGGGVKRRLTTRTELRADVRYILIRDISDEVTDLWRVAGGLTVMLSR
jgi:hypothetical protein